MQPVAILQNSRNDGPGLFEVFAAEHAIPVRVFRRFMGDGLPAAMDEYSGLCVLGSPASANDARPEFLHMERLILDARARRRPVIGHCFGGQMLARALGGQITRAPHAEIGWSDISALSPDWFGAQRFPMVQWHYETFSVPPDATLIARGDLCAHQAFCVDDIHIGMQFHCEVDQAKLDSWLDADGLREIGSADSPGVQSADDILRQASGALPLSTAAAYHLYARWARALPR